MNVETPIKLEEFLGLSESPVTDHDFLEAVFNGEVPAELTYGDIRAVSKAAYTAFKNYGAQNGRLAVFPSSVSRIISRDPHLGMPKKR